MRQLHVLISSSAPASRTESYTKQHEVFFKSVQSERLSRPVFKAPPHSASVSCAAGEETQCLQCEKSVTSAPPLSLRSDSKQTEGDVMTSCLHRTTQYSAET